MQLIPESHQAKIVETQSKTEYMGWYQAEVRPDGTVKQQLLPCETERLWSHKITPKYCCRITASRILAVLNSDYFLKSTQFQRIKTQILIQSLIRKKLSRNLYFKSHHRTWRAHSKMNSTAWLRNVFNKPSGISNTVSMVLCPVYIN